MIGPRALALLATLSLALAVPARPQSGVVSLLVIDDATDVAVSDVRVSIFGAATEGVTDAGGRFVYAAPRAGRIAFVLRRLGYLPGTLMVDVNTTDTARVTFALTVAPHTLETVMVRDTISSVSPFLAGFEGRRRAHAGSATYITRTDIEKAHPVQVTDLLRRIPSITLENGAAISRRTGPMAKCPFQLAVDGELRFEFPLSSLSTEEIHGIEVYSGPASIPPEFNTMRGSVRCGLIVIWTRRDK